MENVIEKDNGFVDQGMVSNLQNELKKSQAKIVRLKAAVKNDNNVSLVGSNIAAKDDQNGITSQRNDLLKLLFHKDSTIERMSSDIQMLEKQLKEALSAKVDALARLEVFEMKGLKEKQTETVNKRVCPTLIPQVHDKRKSHETDHTADGDTPNREKSSPYKVSKGNVDDDNEEEEDDADMRSTTSTPKSDLSVVDIVDIASDGSGDDNGEPSHRENENISSNIQLELLQQVRTRRQNQFVRDAFNGDASSSNGNEEGMAKNSKKIRVEEPFNSSNRPSSSSKRGGNEKSRAVLKINKLKFVD